MSTPDRNSSSLPGLGSLLVIRSKAAATPEMAVKHAGMVIRFGAGITGAEGGIIRVLVGLSIHTMGMETLQKALLRPDVGESELEVARLALQANPIQPRHIAFALRADHETMRNAILDLAAGRAAGSPASAKMPSLSGMIKPNRALQLSMDLNGPLIVTLDRGWSGLAEVLNARKDRLAHAHAQPFRVYILGVGGLLITMGGDSINGFVEAAVDDEVRRVMALTQIALRQYERAHGALPDSLAQLLPPYATQDAQDPWSEQSLHWVKSRMLLYSVGRNGTDDSGDFDLNKPRNGLDRGGKYWWAEPSVPGGVRAEPMK